MSSKLSVNFYRMHTASASLPQVMMGPAVKLLLHRYNLEAGNLIATGPKKNLLKSDILLHINKLKSGTKSEVSNQILKDTAQSRNLIFPSAVASGCAQKYSDIPLSNTRKTIAKRLLQSKQEIPHAYMASHIPADNLLSLKTRFSKQSKTKVSVNDFIIKACSIALKATPEINVQWKKDALVHHPSVDISVAVATEAGLITPILFNVDQLSIEKISNRLRDLADRAKAGKLKPREFQGGSFTISNLGMFGISNFTAIINPPQAAILAVGGMNHFCQENFENGLPAIHKQFTVTLCYDMRAIDELVAQRFLAQLDALLGNPDVMISGVPDSFGRVLPLNELDFIDNNDDQNLLKALL